MTLDQDLTNQDLVVKVMRIKKKRTPAQLKASRDESYGKFGSKAKKSGKINR